MDTMTRPPGVNYPNLPVRSVTGRYLAHAKHTHAEWGFIGADLYTGRRQLVQPTIIQSAALAHNVNRSAVQWALQRSAQRTAIEAGTLPLVPPRPVKMLPAPVSARQKLIEAVAEVGGVDVAIDMITFECLTAA